MIQWMENARSRGVTYSMELRNGPNSYDCSSAVYYALKAGGFLPTTNRIGNTETLFVDLENYGWSKVPASNGVFATKRGDIFIWGIRGSTAGAFGHTGIFFDNNDQIIHCNYADNGINITDHDIRWIANGRPYVTIYRYIGTGVNVPAPDDNGSGSGDGNSAGNLIPMRGTFYPNQTLPISNDMDPSSPAVGTYDAGEAVIYDSYAFANGYAWISYISYVGTRHYIAVGPDDGRVDTVWGNGFFNDDNSDVSQNTPETGDIIPKSGTFTTNRTLEISSDTDPSSPAVGTYDAGESFIYDGYLFSNGYVWLTYVSYDGPRRFVAIGPNDGNTDNTWGTGFFN
ncbi:MAG: SH3 domain-containing protein [Lactobacillaceae bacterium]|nr:SH3 domain-containing protein [Lactobacillaceae bacterium]